MKLLIYPHIYHSCSIQTQFQILFDYLAPFLYIDKLLILLLVYFSHSKGGHTSLRMAFSSRKYKLYKEGRLGRFSVTFRSQRTQQRLFNGTRLDYVSFTRHELNLTITMLNQFLLDCALGIRVVCNNCTRI